MKKIHCVQCKKYRKHKNLEIYCFCKTLVVSVICGKCGSKHKRIYREEESIEILRTLGLIKDIFIGPDLQIYWFAVTQPSLQEICKSKNFFDAHSWKKLLLVTNILS